MWHRACASLLLLVLLQTSAQHGHGAETEKRREALETDDPALPRSYQPAPDEKFFLHIPMFGPNNQLTGLKEVLTLGRLMQRTVITHGIFLHYSDNVKPRLTWQQRKAMRKLPPAPPAAPLSPSVPVFDIFDRDALANFSKVVTIGELKESGWDGRIGGFLRFTGYWNSRYMERMEREHGVNASGAAWVVSAAPLRCSPDRLEAMTASLSQHTVVAVVAYESVVRNAGHGITLQRTGQQCHDTFLQVSRNLVKSPLLRGLAQAFVAAQLGGGEYAAIHVRPYPDDCVDEVWRTKGRAYNHSAALALCERDTENMYAEVAPYTRLTMQRHGVTHLFAMAPPSIRANLTALFGGEGGIAVAYYDQAEFAAATGWNSATMLSMLEVEIASHAKVFIGTLASSMTGSIVQERVVMGRGAPDGTLTFPKTMYLPPPAPVEAVAAPGRHRKSSKQQKGRWKE